MARILVLTSTFPRWQGDHEPPFVYELCRRLAQHNEVHVLAPHAPKALLAEEWDGLHIHRFRYFLPRYQTLAYEGGILTRLKRPRWKSLLVPFFLLAQYVAIVRLLKQHPFDVIHAHWLIPQGLLAVLAARGKKPTIICTAHGADLFALRGRLFNAIKRFVVKRCQHLTVVSGAMQQAAQALGMAAQDITVLPMGVDLQQQFVPNLTQQQPMQLLFVGRLVEKKGLRFLLDALVQVIEKYPFVRLNVVGDGAEKPHLLAQVADKKLHAHVHFFGAVKNSALPAFYQEAAIVVFPSIVASNGDQEGFGLVSVEALGCGCAVIATDLPAMQDMLHHLQTAWIVPQQNATVLAEAIQHLLSQPTLRQQLAATGRQTVLQRYDWSQIAQAYHLLLNKT